MALFKETRPLVVEPFIDQNRCDEYVAFFRRNVPQPRSYQGLVDFQLRACEFVKGAPLATDFLRLIEDYVKPYYSIGAATLTNIPLIYRYPEGVGFVVHHDRVTQIELDRRTYNKQPVVGGDFTMVLFLNDPTAYLGGELYFPNLHLTFKPFPGSAIVFPATEDFMHGVAPVKGGERFTSVARCAMT